MTSDQGLTNEAILAQRAERQKIADRQVARAALIASNPEELDASRDKFASVIYGMEYGDLDGPRKAIVTRYVRQGISAYDAKQRVRQRHWANSRKGSGLGWGRGR